VKKREKVKPKQGNFCAQNSRKIPNTETLVVQLRTEEQIWNQILFYCRPSLELGGSKTSIFIQGSEKALKEKISNFERSLE